MQKICCGICYLSPQVGALQSDMQNDLKCSKVKDFRNHQSPDL